MNLRLLFAMTSCLAAGFLGTRWSARMKADTTRLADWLSLLDRLHLVMAEGARSLPDALDAAALHDVQPDLLLRRLAAGLRDDPTAELGTLYRAYQPASAPEHSVIDQLMAELDRGALESRLLAIEQARGVIQLMHTEHADRSARDAPMWTRLGWTAGACILILLM